MPEPHRSMPAVSQYAPKPPVAGPPAATTATATSNAMNPGASSGFVSPGGASTAAASSGAMTAAGAATGAGDAGLAAVGVGDWRDKDADRSARQQVARIILTLIMKSANRPASVNYNPREIARRLEHTLYMGAASKADYSNVQTLKARLQLALDNSRRRQMQQQQQQTRSQQVPTSAAPANLVQQQQQSQAQQLQARQLALLQRQQQQQLAAQLHSQRAGFQAVPFPGASPQTPVSTNQPLQMPLAMSQLQTKTSTTASTTSSGLSTRTSAASGGGAASNSILDELEREADEMANGVSDQPLAMPESELQAGAATATATATATVGPSASSLGMASGGTFAASGTPSVASPTVGPGSFHAMPLSMPPEISAGLGTPASSAGFAPQQSAPMMRSATAAAGTNLYHGMNLTGPQIQQIQQIQQMQQLRRVQQLQQLQQQQQQHVRTASTPLANGTGGAQATAVGVATSGASTTPTSRGGTATSPGMMPMNDVSIAQKREELKRRLIQLKHARTCPTGECGVDYCSRTKALLAHVSRCANAQCTTIGCKSTRQLLSHFRKCRNLQCDVCSAIRPPMNESEQQLVLRRQQERLCMLRHASTCTATQCVLPYCAGMKVLWKHICECHQRQCRTDHCISSRYVLSHFKQCNKTICEVCGPVRRAIKVVDSCRGNPAQLQLAAAQCPDGVRGLIKIMNAVTATAPSASSALSAHQMNHTGSAGVSGAERHAGQQTTGWTGAQSQAQTSGTVKMEAKSHASGQQATSTSGLNAASNAMSQAANVAVTSSGRSPRAAAAGTPGSSTAAATSEALAKSTSLLEEMKKKPLKLQTEKEKKLRRKEQAKIAKARAQAKAQAAAAQEAAAVAGTALAQQTAGAVAPPVLHNGLVVRGSQAALRSDRHVSHQDISFLDSMTEGQLDEHIRSLRFNFCGHITLTELKNRLMPLLSKLMDSEYGWTFNNPVDPVQWNIPDYFDIIKCPMDLGSIKKRLESEHYNSVEAFAGDVRLVFENCIAYNSSTNKFNMAAKQLLAAFNKALAALKNQLEKQLFKRCEQRREEMCQLCGGDSFKFAPCMLFCSGPCAGRIRRHTHYYSDPRGEHHWCSSCYKQMKDGPIDMSLLPQLSSAATTDDAATAGATAPAAAVPFDGVLKKSSLLKRKNSEVAEEPWVECDSCKLWYHQICALFNERNHAISGEQEPFVCPICVKKQRAAGVKPSLSNGLKAKRLPITRMAKLIETRVLEAIEQAGKDEAVRMGNMGNSDSIGFSSGAKESVSDSHLGITIREVLSIDKQVQIKPRMGKLLADKYGKGKKEDAAATPSPGTTGQPKSLKRPRSTTSAAEEKKQQQDKKAALAASTAASSSLHLTYRSRCICVFQELDGVDVLIFTLYVQEYGPESLAPNAGRVYVSYLDSVNYFQPKKLRTLMHQQVMLGFLEDCKNRGFHTCHIWSCPPLKGDDYIFFCKPENQKIPKSARLRQWYQKLLQQAKQDGLVVNISNLYAEYYMKKKAAHELPYFEGDYWPRLAEDLIKQLEEKDGRGSTKTAATADATPGNGTSAAAAANGSSSSGVGNGGETPTTRSPGPSEANGHGDGTGKAGDPSDASSKGAVAAKAQVDPKNKKKRSKKGAPSTPTAMTRSSTSKTRSKKGGKLGRQSANSAKNAINSDPLMQKLKGILEPQKEDFFVVDLHPKCHKCGVPIVHTGYWQLKTLPPPASVVALLEAAKKTRSSSSSSRNSPPRHYHYCYCAGCYEANKTQLVHRVEVAGNGAKHAKDLSARILPLNEKVAAAELAELDLQEIKFDVALTFVDPAKEAEEVAVKEEAKQETTPQPEAKDAVSSETKAKEKTNAKAEDAVAAPTDSTEQKDAESKPDATMEDATDTKETAASTAAEDKEKAPSKQEDAVDKEVEDNKKTSGPAAPRKPGRVIGDDLDDVIMPCEIFDTREAFLMYCQNNHCQFDQIRRAKHSSMMVLYHLFNQGTTGFTFSCSRCKTTLLSGNRWNCSICPVFNLCDACKAKTTHDHPLHLFKVVSIPRPGGEVSKETTSSKVEGVVSSASRTGGVKREAGSAELKRARHVKNSDKGAGKKAATRKRKLPHSSPAATPPAVTATTASSPAPAAPGPGASTTAAVAANGDAHASATTGGSAATGAATGAATATSATGEAAEEGDASKKRRIHNIDPQLLLQLEHASACTTANCSFLNCSRMQAMLKHGAVCEQRLTGPCVLCKRIIGLLSAHARQCTKEGAACKVPRCADIRRHFVQQMQQRQQQLQLQRARQQQQQQQQSATATANADETKDAAA